MRQEHLCFRLAGAPRAGPFDLQEPQPAPQRQSLQACAQGIHVLYVDSFPTFFFIEEKSQH